jgi:hypothetical protein
MSNGRIGGTSLLDEINVPASSGGGKPSPGRKPSGGGGGGMDRGQKIKAIAAVAMVAVAAGIAYFTLGDALATPGGDTSRIDVVDASDPNNLVQIRGFRAPAGSLPPFLSPTTGKPMVFPAERCYWTKDGKGKLEPTLVLLNEHIGKEGQTLCPDCGRVVFPRFPYPPAEVMDEAVKANRKN